MNTQRSLIIAYYKGQEHIDFSEMVNYILGQYDPVDIDAAKVADIREKILQLPEKKGFDRQFNSAPKTFNARIRKTYEAQGGIGQPVAPLIVA